MALSFSYWTLDGKLHGKRSSPLRDRKGQEEVRSGLTQGLCAGDFFPLVSFLNNWLFIAVLEI